MKEKIYKYKKLWKNCELKEKIGEGTYGKVYRLEYNDGKKFKDSVVKIISFPTSAQIKQATDLKINNKNKFFKAKLEKLVEEIEYMSIFKEVYNVVDIEDYHIKKIDNKIKWDILIKMEYLMALDEYKSQNNFTKKDVLKLGIDITKALIECNKKNIIHRDIKEENIFINENLDYKLGDFGISERFEKKSSDEIIEGTPYYMSPEVYMNEGYDHTIDFYSLGIVMYKLLNNDLFPLSNDVSEYRKAFHKRMKNETIPYPTHAKDELGDTVLKMMSYTSENRYKDGKALLESLGEYLSKHGDELKNTVLFDRNDMNDLNLNFDTEKVFIESKDKKEVLNNKFKTELIIENIPEKDTFNETLDVFL